MKNRIISFSVILSMLIASILGLAACTPTADPVKLEAPAVTVQGNVARWEPVTGAVAYEVDNGSKMSVLGADRTSYTMSEGETIRVRAGGNGKTYISSEWSAYVTCTSHVHTDSDRNDICDTCKKSVIVVIDFYSINDLHGKFCDTNAQPGVNELATYLKSRDEVDDNVIILSAGDMWQGSAESNLTDGHIITEWMNEMGFVSMTLGNHEYDWGEAPIESNHEIAEFPFLAINIFDVDTGKRVDYCEPSVMVDRGGVQIGIIGAIGDCYTSIATEMRGGYYFKVGSELTALVKAESESLRARGADIVIYALHDGYASSKSGTTNVSAADIASYYDTSLSDGYIDLVFEGHMHTSYVLVDEYGVYHLQAGGYNEGLSHAELKWNSANQKLEVLKAEIVGDNVYSASSDDAETLGLMNKYNEVITKAYTPIGNVSFAQDTSALKQLMADVYLTAGLERWGDEYNIVLAGGSLNPRDPKRLAAGAATYADVLELFPFNNRLVLCSVSGADLKSRFIENSSYPTALSEYGNSILGSIADTETYYIVTDRYSSLYSTNNLTEVELYDDGVYGRDLLADYIASGALDSSPSEDDYTLTSIAEVLSNESGLENGATSAVMYYVKAEITSIVQTKYGNMYLNDGAEIYVYGLYKDGILYNDLAEKPMAGDTVIIAGYIKNYNGTIEFINAELIEIVEE